MGTLGKMDMVDMKFNKDNIFMTSSAAERDIRVVAKKIESAEEKQLAVAKCDFEVS